MEISALALMLTNAWKIMANVSKNVQIQMEDTIVNVLTDIPEMQTTTVMTLMNVGLKMVGVVTHVQTRKDPTSAHALLATISDKIRRHAMTLMNARITMLAVAIIAQTQEAVIIAVVQHRVIK